jgi:hypothetical protein
MQFAQNSAPERVPRENDAANCGEDSSKTAPRYLPSNSAIDFGEGSCFCPAAIRRCLQIAATGCPKDFNFVQGMVSGEVANIAIFNHKPTSSVQSIDARTGTNPEAQKNKGFVVGFRRAA